MVIWSTGKNMLPADHFFSLLFICFLSVSAKIKINIEKESPMLSFASGG